MLVSQHKFEINLVVILLTEYLLTGQFRISPVRQNNRLRNDELLALTILCKLFYDREKREPDFNLTVLSCVRLFACYGGCG